jgi:hypothetical protein
VEVGKGNSDGGDGRVVATAMEKLIEQAMRKAKVGRSNVEQVQTENKFHSVVWEKSQEGRKRRSKSNSQVSSK